jgi:hypothetical protein
MKLKYFIPVLGLDFLMDDDKFPSFWLIWYQIIIIFLIFVLCIAALIIVLCIAAVNHIG